MSGEFEPLIVDPLTARAMVTLHNALNSKNQATFEEWVGEHRGKFAALVEMSWEKVRIGR